MNESKIMGLYLEQDSVSTILTIHQFLYGLSDSFFHYGVKRRSGRYPYGSGEDPYQHEAIAFLATIDEHRRNKMTNTQIAEKMGVSRNWLENEITLANHRLKKSYIKQAKSMRADGKTYAEIGARLGCSENSAKNYANSKGIKEQQFDNLCNELRKQVDQVKYLDVGDGIEYQLDQLDTSRQLGVTKKYLSAAVQQLEHEGYYTHKVYIRNDMDPTKSLTVKVLTKEPDKTVVFKNNDQIRSPKTWSDDGGLTWQNIKDPINIDSSRIFVRYKEDGGEDKDGTIELRRNVADLDLGGANYAQVRIGVHDGDNKLYCKGMALYSDDIPDGYDIVVNSNKKRGTEMKDVLKPQKDNKDNPFGASISRQIGERDSEGNLVKVTSACNIVNQEGKWDEWGRTLSSQFLSKQPYPVVKERLDATIDAKKELYNDILTVKQPTVRKYLLDNLADGCEKDASHLQAKGYPGERAQVILPLTNIKPTEIYAPNYENGSTVVLIRYPHGGTFELPELKVNNNNKEGKSVLKNAIDAVGIHPSVASKMSGADFDGDTVYVLPISDINKGIKTSPSLPGLKDFNTKEYQVPKEQGKTISKKEKELQMGIVSNLITDMTLQGAPTNDIERAVRHSMVVIDSEKHNLDWKRSAEENGIQALHERYQGRKTGGASTIISRAAQPVHLDKRGNVLKAKQRQLEYYDGRIDPKTGKKKTYSQTYYVNPETGEEVKTVRTKTKMQMTDDAYTLVSSKPNAVEKLYADFANDLKSIRSQAMMESKMIQSLKPTKEAKEKYAKEIESLERQIVNAQANAPQERQARIQAHKYYTEKKGDVVTSDDRKKLASQITNAAREKVGSSSKKVRIHPTNKEWEAIEAGALSATQIKKILRYMDSDELYERVLPRETKTISPSKLNRARSMKASGKTWNEISKQLGVPISTLTYNLQ